ncbi:MAG TPA: Ig-like domain-containing protein [Actinomycetota bacterium]
MRKTIAPLTALVAVLALLPAQAAERSVDVLDFRFEPYALQAFSGDTVTWNWQGTQPHNITAYSGASFASPSQRNGSFSVTFGGGTVLYRCTLHSTIDQGPCNGMCGIISNDVTPPAAPTIAQPAAGTTVASPVRIGGTAPGAATVLVRNETGTLGEAVVSGDGSWSLDVTLPDGAHAVIAIARSTLGIESEPSGDHPFTVDATPPQITITSPGDLSIVGDPVAASGTASDERMLHSVTLELTDLVLGGVSTATATVAADGSWTATVDAPHPGPHQLLARARDAAGNAAETTPVILIVGIG